METSTRQLLKHIQNKAIKRCFTIAYIDNYDTCDSKKDKSPVGARVRVRARGCFYVFWQSNFQSLVLASYRLGVTSKSAVKTIRRFMQSDPLFLKSDPSFYEK